MFEFPQDVIEAAQEAERKFYPFGPFVSVTLAQWALESAYGRAEPPGSDNAFGIKAVPGQDYVVAMTHETLHGVYVELPQHFAKFNSLADAFDAHARLLATAPCYHAAQAAQTPEVYAMALQGVYATGIPGHPYGTALIAIMRTFDLYRYDVSHETPHAATG
jgi:flagellum-specific peptidoglycan hydrolase FlgJ